MKAFFNINKASIITIAFGVVLISTCISLLDAGLNELCEQMDYYQKSPLLNCLRYDDYGCWCGPGGSGKPVDGAGILILYILRSFDSHRRLIHFYCIIGSFNSSQKDGVQTIFNDDCWKKQVNYIMEET